MFGWLKAKRRSPMPLRDTLFGDLPLEDWPPEPGAQVEEPWSSFVVARDSIKGGHRAEAVAKLQSVLAQEGLESRHYLEAWEALRTLGVKPPDTEAKRVLGVVVEAPMEEGLTSSRHT